MHGPSGRRAYEASWRSWLHEGQRSWTIRTGDDAAMGTVTASRITGRPAGRMTVHVALR